MALIKRLSRKCQQWHQRIKEGKNDLNILYFYLITRFVRNIILFVYSKLNNVFNYYKNTLKLILIKFALR